jgi:hypothetical protein
MDAKTAVSEFLRSLTADDAREVMRAGIRVMAKPCTFVECGALSPGLQCRICSGAQCMSHAFLRAGKPTEVVCHACVVNEYLAAVEAVAAEESAGHNEDEPEAPPPKKRRRASATRRRTKK